MVTYPPTHGITIRCDACGHTESFTAHTAAKTGHAWEQPCNECGHNWSTITDDGA